MGSQATTHGNLYSYVSRCDWVTTQFGSRVQAGQVFTLSTPKWHGIGGHLIDTIQKDLCQCLTGQDGYRLTSHDTRDRPPSNSELCPS